MVRQCDREYAVWVTRDELGKKKEIHVEGSTVTFMVPQHIDGHVVLRLKGLGYRNGQETGNLLVRINLMEDDRTSEWFPFNRNRQPQSSKDGFDRFSWVKGSQEHGMKDPMKMRRAGYLIAGAGLVLVAGGYLGILPLSAWAGVIFVAAGLYIARFV